MGAVKVDAEIHFSNGDSKIICLSVGQADVGQRQLIRRWFKAQLDFMALTGRNTGYREQLKSLGLLTPELPEVDGKGRNSFAAL